MGILVGNGNFAFRFSKKRMMVFAWDCTEKGIFPHAWGV